MAMYTACGDSETWPLTKTNMERLQGHIQTDLQYQARGCGHGKVKRRSTKIKLEDLILRERRPRWFEHVEQSSDAVRTACDIQIYGRLGVGG